MLGLLVAVLGYNLRVWYEMAKVKLHMQDSVAALKDFTTVREAILELARFQNNDYILSKSHPLLSYVGRTTNREFYNSVEIDDKKFSIINEDWALKANAHFWRELTEMQKKQGRESAIEVLITHTTAIELWQGPSAEISLQQQGQFVAEGGIIRRILVGPSPLENDAYKSVRETMSARRINVYYYGGGLPRAKYDFSWVQGSDIVMKWYQYIDNAAIHQCVIEQGLDLDVRDRWEFLWSQVKNQDSIGSEHVVTAGVQNSDSKERVGVGCPVHS